MRRKKSNNLATKLRWIVRYQNTGYEEYYEVRLVGPCFSGINYRERIYQHHVFDRCAHKMNLLVPANMRKVDPEKFVEAIRNIKREMIQNLRSDRRVKDLVENVTALESGPLTPTEVDELLTAI